MIPTRGLRASQSLAGPGRVRGRPVPVLPARLLRNTLPPEPAAGGYPVPPETTRRAPLLPPRYTPKKVWPPDFSRLSEREQFRFERRYKRRVLLATARPRWDRAVRLAQWACIVARARARERAGFLVYIVLFFDAGEGREQPFQGIRDQFWELFAAFSPEQRYVRRADPAGVEAATGLKAEQRQR
ncbi:hypothetical protein GGS23DRAFT_595697 [Durotheca rogersii]|uniref:uncharacterized protein n=1 Tax=Durotheca rogersii TaxID=419775 RepID=UPI00221FA020|nr:uncharacterized protein GGS23DRAFT_595697 [Durotheca rogersii]KAI5864047.1 hypothetical protein GGS23DRAFT_595697 [Durotheca rogersii]